jgi:hypothetical protein
MSAQRTSTLLLILWRFLEPILNAPETTDNLGAKLARKRIGRVVIEANGARIQLLFS